MLVYEYLGSMRRAAAALKISTASICRWSKCIQPKVRTRGSSKLTTAMEALILSHLKDHPATNCMGLRELVMETFGVEVSRQLVHAMIRRSGYTFKRTRKRGISNKPDNRVAFCAAFASAYNSNSLVAIDESGFDQRCRPVYGYAPRGRPAIVKARPSSDRRRFSLLMAISSSGQACRHLSDNPIKGKDFATFVSHLPFSPGTTLLLDNASIHKTLLVRQTAQQKGFALLYCPPYTPEFNPIELVFGVIKNRFYKSRYTEQFKDLKASIEECVEHAAAPGTIQGCFRHVKKLTDSESKPSNE